MINLAEIETLITVAKSVKRVPLVHHVRSSFTTDYLKNISKEVIEPNVDIYSMCCQNILLNSPIEFLNYMFDETITDNFDTSIKTNLKQNCPNFYVSHNSGEATIIFDSLTNEQNNDFAKIANIWANNKNIKFIPITGDYTTTKTAELFANYCIYTNPDKHIVFVVKDMVSRSFSVPKIVNGIMMVNEPEFAPAMQKMNRLSTIDFENPNKTANMYWFNFNNLKVKCPLYMLIYNDYLKYHKTGTSLMLDSANICEQCQNYQKEKQCEKWTETDLFNRINHGIVKHSIVKNYLTNYINDVLGIVDGMLQNINIKNLNIKNTTLGSTEEISINAGKSKTTNAREASSSEAETQILSNEIITTLTLYTLSHEQQDRDFETFIADSCNILGSENTERIMPDLLSIWNTFFVTHINDLLIEVDLY